MTGRSTSKKRSAVVSNEQDIPATGLNKQGFLHRVNEISMSLYNLAFTASQLDDLIYEGLVPNFERYSNDGLRPQFFATAAQYRRILQIQKLRAKRIHNRDAQLVQLFLRWNAAPVWQIRAALRNQYIRALKSLRVHLRSTLFQNDEAIKLKGLDVVSKQLGVIDTRFVEAMLNQPTLFYVHAVRSALGGSQSDVFSGSLVYDDELDRLSPRIEAVFDLDDKKILQAANTLRFLNQLVLKPLVGHGVIDSPQFVVSAFVAIALAANDNAAIDSFKTLPNREGFALLAQQILLSFQQSFYPKRED